MIRVTQVRERTASRKSPADKRRLAPPPHGDGRTRDPRFMLYRENPWSGQLTWLPRPSRCWGEQRL